jgi:hypothetical protein
MMVQVQGLVVRAPSYSLRHAAAGLPSFWARGHEGLEPSLECAGGSLALARLLVSTCMRATRG